MSLTLLFIEDDRDLQSLVTRFLQERGVRVEVARTAAEARVVLARVRLDAAVVDGLLPDMTGADFIAELRTTHPELPVLFASAFWRDLKSYELLTRQLKVQRVLHKPYSPGELWMWVQELLGERAPAAVAPEEPPAPAADGGLAQALAALTAEYGAALPERFSALRAAVERARSGGGGEALREALVLVHKLHGTAGSYGFDRVSAVAGRLEALLRRVPEGAGGSGGTEDAWREAEGLLQELVRVGTPDADTGMGAGTGGERDVLGAVLVVDDDEPLLQAAARLAAGHQVRLVIARSAEEALEAARRGWLDGALVHAHLGQPGGGFAVAQRLRSQDGLASLPLAFYADGAALQDRVAAAHAGGSLFLPRPFSAAELVSAVERFVSARRPDKARIVVLDDDADATRVLTGALQADGHEVSALSNPHRLLEMLSGLRPDLLLMDVMMPGLGGLDLCKILRSMPEWQELPILLVTAQTDVAFRVAAFQAGADDYLAKPVLREELLARVRGRLERARLARELRERDALTGLPLRRPFLDTLRGRLAEAGRSNTPVSLALIDLDRFKAINDTYGHLSGDQVLGRFGRLLAARFRKEDARGRWGGEEFVVALYGEGPERARDILARSGAEFARLVFEGEGEARFSATFSAGIATFPADGATAEDLLRAADARLYRAKALGRNRIEID
ncbi:response regulator [Aggregicoccus sp. 17bor-14]|uniref:response regulator n=1 Tax=Myxococcaceae TaxID=31 RepID=UPI00129CAE12|nr:MULTISPECIES: response regulator [Myxococcaceae]MBF5045495.1 response regulator [Simulacricoccus sp. 17bor-14]MRI91232.1 response regulator [Aggregicoccus sp. 17bor-14]